MYQRGVAARGTSFRGANETPSLPMILIALLLVPACRAQDAATPVESQSLPPIEVHFSPRGGCTEAVVKEIGAARSVAAFGSAFVS